MSAIGLRKLVIVALSLIISTTALATTYTYLTSTGTIMVSLTIGSFPHASRIGESISISGLVADASGKGRPGLFVTIQYSNDHYQWNNASATLTDELGIYRTNLSFSSSGLYYIRATFSRLTSSIRHVVADFLVSTNGLDDFADIQMAIDALSSKGGVVYVRSGEYHLNPEVKYPFKSIVLRSNLTLVGEGIDKAVIKVFPTKQPANSGVRVDGITSLNDIENLIIEDFTLVQNGTPDNNGTSAVAFRFGNHRNIAIRNIKVTDAFGSGIAIPNFNEVVVENCVINNVWTGIIVAGGSFGLLKNNIVTNTRGDGIFLLTNKDEGLSVTDSVIEGNYLENIGDTGIDITAKAGFAPHERIVAKNNTLKNASVRVSHAIDVQFVNNTVDGKAICVDAGQGRPINITVVGNHIVTSASAAIGFYGVRNAIAANNTIEMGTPKEGITQSGIKAAIWGTGLIENNTILNAANYGISFGNWGLGDGCNITMRGNIILDFHEIGIYDDAKRQGGFVLIEENIIADRKQPFVSRYCIRTDCESNKWIIRNNRVYGGRISFISAPGSDIYDNIYEL